MAVENCNLCGSKVRLAQINFTEAIYICENVKCIYPFNPIDNGCNITFIRRDFTGMKIKETSTQPTLCETPSSSLLNNDVDDFLDNFFSNSNSAAITECDIQAVDSIFEALQGYDEHK